MRRKLRLTCIIFTIGLHSACLAEFSDSSDNLALSLIIGAALSDSPEFSGIRVSRSNPQSFASGETASPLFETTDFATGAFVGSFILNNLSIRTQDVYLLNGGVDFQGAATGGRSIQFLDPNLVAGGQRTPGVVSAPTAHSIGLLRQLPQGAAINLQARQTTAAALSTSAEPTTNLGVVRMNRAVASAAVVRKTAPQPIPNNVPTLASFQTADYDTGGYFNAAQQDRLFIQESGVYLIVANARLASTGTASGRGVELFVNGTLSVARDVRSAGIAAEGAADVSTVYRLNAGDTISMRYFHNGGGAFNLLPNFTTMAIARLDTSTPTARNILFRGAPAGIPTVTTGVSTPLDLSAVLRADAAYAVTDSTNATILQNGVYLIVANVQFANSNFGRRDVELNINAAPVTRETRNSGAVGSGTLNLLHMRQLNAGDTVNLSVFQNTGGNLALVPAACFLQMIKLD